MMFEVGTSRNKDNSQGASERPAKSRGSKKTADRRHQGPDASTGHNHDAVGGQDVHSPAQTAADVESGQPVAPSRTNRDRRRDDGRGSHQQQDNDINERRQRHDTDDVPNDDSTDRSRNSLAPVDKNDNLPPASETDDVTNSEITTGNEDILQIRKMKTIIIVACAPLRIRIKYTVCPQNANYFKA